MILILLHESTLDITLTHRRASTLILTLSERREGTLADILTLSHKEKTHSLLLSHTDGENTRTLTAAYTGEADTHSHALRQQGRALALLHRDSHFLTQRNEGALTFSQEGGKHFHSQPLTQREA